MRWNVAGRLVSAWVITLPASGAVGAVAYFVQHGIGGGLGDAVVLAALVVACAGFWWAARRKPVSHDNVNDEWDAGIPAPQPATAA
ncbi:hypothetical protein GCM10025864_14570 [Luteimicrobium album]|uniref:Uncharacterized protein n=1 Tax=Luteimicrobium album TaxID=1054550 RepID=A0ABQ6HYX8_9MICO|nr:hypothetical protein GCM10025864_14570 [Luteimicrobium album]